MTLDFEFIQSNDGNIVKRAKVPGGYIYLFEAFDMKGNQVQMTSCFVPSTPFLGPQSVKLNADDLHALTHKR